MYRRRYLRLVGGIGAVGLAGCSDNPGDGDSPTASPTGTETATPTPSATAADTPTPTATETPTATGTPLPEVAAEVLVGPDGEFVFDPDRVEVAVGDTVRWRWRSGGHNVKPEDIPGGSDWTGSPGGRGDTLGSGAVYSHTFEVAGTYDYICVPHQSLGMTGTVVVG